MSQHESLGLSAQVYSPMFGEIFSPIGSSLGEFDFGTYTHTITTGVGFDTLSMSAATALEKAYWWLANACGAHVEVQDQTGVVVWEGRVDSVTIQEGGLTIMRGPLLDVANRVIVSYQLLESNSSIVEPTVSTGEGQEQKRTNAANHETSQARYGIQTQVLSGGTITTARARNIRNTYLTLNAWPRMPQDAVLGGSASVSVTLECRGYWHWLKYPYRLANTEDMVHLSDKIATVLAADPNSFFDGANQIAANTMHVPALEDQERSASEIIAGLVGMGDTTYQRYVFGVWANRACIYGAAPVITEYQYRTDDKRQVVEDMAGAVVQPWSVLPGKWVEFTRVQPGSLDAQVGVYQSAEDPRTMFIEQVKYTAPYGFSMSGGVVNSLVQRLAQWGLTGLGRS